MHQGALALIDVEEGAATVADSAQQAWPTGRKTRSRWSPLTVFIRPPLVTCWQIAGKRRSGALGA